MGRATLILGGIRSGKSAFAEKLAGENLSPTLYLATGLPVDLEMEERIRRHRQNRPAAWRTLEAPLDLTGPLETVMAEENAPSVVLIDSLDGWVGNLLFDHEDYPALKLEALALSHIQRLAELMRESQTEFFLVSQVIAASAETVYLVAAGLPMKLKGPAKGADFS